MSTNGHGQNLELLVGCVRNHGGRVPLEVLLQQCRPMKRAAFDSELEKAGCPLVLRFEYNGGTSPEELVQLRDPDWQPERISQADAAKKLNALSYDEWLNLMDPTRKIRLSNKRGHRRTSTGAEEYLMGNQ